MTLKNAGMLANTWWDDRTLEGSRGGNDIVGVNHAIRRFDPKSRSTDVPAHKSHLHAATDRGSDLFRISDEIVRDRLLGGKGIGIETGKLHAGKSIVPGRAIGNQGVPSLRPPALGNAVPLDDQMRHAAIAQMLAHGQP